MRGSHSRRDEILASEGTRDPCSSEKARDLENILASRQAGETGLLVQ